MNWTCPSCGSVSQGSYCPACGERRLVTPMATAASTTAQPLRGAAARDWLARLHASLQALASPPGRLTRDWLEGRRVGYLAPVSLFLYVNIAFFLIQSASGISILSWPLAVHLDNDMLGISQKAFDYVAGAKSATDPKYMAVFNAVEVVHAKALVLIMVPLFAASLLLVPALRRWRFAGAFTFSAHYHAYALIMLSAIFPLVALTLLFVTHLGFGTDKLLLTYVTDKVVSCLQAALLGWYIARTLQTVTAIPRWQRLLWSVAMVTVTYAVLRLYHLVVFFTTLLSL